MARPNVPTSTQRLRSWLLGFIAGPPRNPIQQEKCGNEKGIDAVKRVSDGMRLSINRPEHLRAKGQRACDNHEACRAYGQVKPAPAFEPFSFHCYALFF